MSDVNEFAARLRRNEGDPNPGYFSAVYKDGKNCPDFDAWQITRLLLLDETEPDETWLRSVGFETAVNDNWIWIKGDVAISRNIEGRWSLSVIDDDGESIFIPPPKSRAAVRCLALALGITLTERKDAV
jgi:hypothetical protein